MQSAVCSSVAMMRLVVTVTSLMVISVQGGCERHDCIADIVGSNNVRKLTFVMVTIRCLAYVSDTSLWRVARCAAI